MVDGEPRVAEALARVFSELAPSWEVATAQNNLDALVHLRERPYDVVLTELQGEALDGAALLAQVATQHPQAARFVLSGRHDHDAPLELLRHAHQLLPKPCAAETLHHVLSRLVVLAQLLSERELQTLAHQASHLPSSPDLRRDPRVLRTDPAFVAKVMQLAASGFVCGSSKVADIDSALQQLGAHWTERLSQAHCEPRDSEAARRLRGRSVRIARVASSLATLPEDAASAYLAGLLCDVGQLLPAQADPERRHAELGAYQLGLWGLPFQVVEAVAHHHAPNRAAADCVGLTQLVWLAACVVEGKTPSADVLAGSGVEDVYVRAQQSHRALLLEESRDAAQSS